MKSYHIVVCASGRGGNFESLVRHSKENGYFVTNLIVNKECLAIDKAKQLGIPYTILPLGKERFVNFDQLIPRTTDLIVLAGFLPIIPASISQQFEIVNIHPSLLPKYGGKGMYGIHVQEAVLKNNETESGCTVHLVSSEVDGGEILLQKKVSVYPDDTPAILAQRIYLEELKLLPKAVLFLKERILKQEEL